MDAVTRRDLLNCSLSLERFDRDLRFQLGTELSVLSHVCLLRQPKSTLGPCPNFGEYLKPRQLVRAKAVNTLQSLGAKPKSHLVLSEQFASCERSRRDFPRLALPRNWELPPCPSEESVWQRAGPGMFCKACQLCQ